MMCTTSGHVCSDMYQISINWDTSTIIGTTLIYEKTWAKSEWSIGARIDLNRLMDRKSQYETNWKNNLEYLIPEKLKVPCERNSC